MNRIRKCIPFDSEQDSGYGPANESRRYIVTSPLIGRAHTQNDLWSVTQTVCIVIDLFCCNRAGQSSVLSYWVALLVCDCSNANEATRVVVVVGGGGVVCACVWIDK